MILLPQLGGRIFAGLDKTNGVDFFYRQHVIKPALIGLFGSWISGGAEFNFPQHHRPSTFMPMDYLIEENPDGSRTVWMSEHEPTQRMKGMVGVCLHPGKALVETNFPKWKCHVELPSEDVEECIRYYKSKGPELDPSKPADPGRKYKQDLQKLEAGLAQVQESARRRERELKEELAAKEFRIQEILDKQSEDEEMRKREDDKKKQDEENLRLEKEKENKNKKLKKSAKVRGTITGLVITNLLLLSILLASHYGEGLNFFQKQLNFWPLHGAVVAVGLILSGFIIGKERIVALGWPLNKLLNLEEN